MVRRPERRDSGQFFRWIVDAWNVPPRNPPIGSNRDLALVLLRFLVLVALVLSGLMAAVGYFLTSASTLSTAVAVVVFFLTLHLYLFWERLPLTWVRATLLIALTGFLVRWVAALHFLAAREVPVALFSSMVYVPMLLVVFSLMEGQRRSVAVGLGVAAIMGVSLTLAAWRPELSVVHLDDPRLGVLVSVFMAVFVFFLNAWGGQQTDLEEAEMQTLLLKERINSDPLTGLLNRRGVDLAVTSLMSRREPFGVLLIDIDHFKAINDTLGHDAGDRAIKALANKLRNVARDRDVVGRWGGEEFIMLSPSSEPRSIEGFAQRVRREAAAMEVPGVPAMTISVGITRFPLYEPFEETVKRADDALYTAKAQGRNCVRSEWGGDSTDDP
jgi:diguanylate cyclase (GGDEF)-like protein